MTVLPHRARDPFRVFPKSRSRSVPLNPPLGFAKLQIFELIKMRIDILILIAKDRELAVGLYLKDAAPRP